MPTAPPVGDRAAGAAMAHASASMADEESRHLWSVQSELRSALSLLERARRNRACARALALDAGEPARGSWASVFVRHQDATGAELARDRVGRQQLEQVVSDGKERLVVSN